ncbi:uncharacterized protein LY89DRAFT_679571 [Mollisia scopiformis]|uniref:Structure-specific endonuclease subunit SLX4 n=1 Tax=Mollisia scopiformis TaxID=149040 RepID=A0A194XWB2_MOLSC|nr:uncharacterized protein LY89DRAFT_679571 [Mollisia scopiformis]KUJ24426.1 hypothetical protein LY89DRAFT_679571 [Mollisia scopiformis]
MATEMLILSSSPPRQFASFSLSSSPLPSMEEIVQKRSQVLRTGSRAAPIPQNASASYTTAASLLKSTASLDVINSCALEEDTPETKPAKVSKPRKVPIKKEEDESKSTKKPGKAVKVEAELDNAVVEKKKSKPRTKKVVDNPSEPLEKKSAAPKPRRKKADKEAGETDIPKEKPVRKPRVKKVDGESQPKLSTGKVTKTSKPTKTKSDSASNSHKVKSESQELALQKALKRRVGWTPPVPTSKTIGVTTSENILSSGGLGSGEKRSGFADLFGSFGFTKLENSSDPIPVGTDITRKRKLVDLVKTNVTTAAAESPISKEKAPKKKARTLTDQATSAYTEEEELPAQPAPLLQYFSLQPSERSTSDGFKVPPKPRSKSPVKGSSKVKKGSAEAPILLSPESAMKQVGKQDFVFGTSSQLARGDSPTLLRDLHAAMQASNEEDDSFPDSVFDSSPPVSRRTTGLTTKRNLWSAASRDDSGELLDVPMIDLVDSPAIDNHKPAVPVVPKTPAQLETDIWHDIGTTPAAKPGGDSPKVLGPIEAAIRTELLSSPSGSRGVRSPKAPKVAKVDEPVKLKSPASKPKSPAKGKKVIGPQKPNFAAYTDVQLAKEIASYQFKPIKKREQMILLLQRCWESKNQAALSNVSTNIPVVPAKISKDVAPPSTQPTEQSPKRARGRPRKDNTIQYLEMDSNMPLSQARTPKKAGKKAGKKVTQETDDISDSDNPATPSPPRRSASQMTPLKLRASESDMSDSPELSPGAAEERLFKNITKAVTSAPRSKDPLNPNWNEKILLYDPIVIEDLTIWLNTGALGKVGWDGEVEPKLVKKWCESKSICCLWRENLRGGARSRY